MNSAKQCVCWPKTEKEVEKEREGELIPSLVQYLSFLIFFFLE
jgi:hypothetical protein